MDKRLETNRKNWNERTPVHAESGFYDVAGFKAGSITLRTVEREEVGDVSGKSLLHLQCHFGLDTMSWSRLGAHATGVDFSEDAIRLARSLNAEVGTDARFVHANVYDLPEVLDEEFDIVFTSYGVLVWLPDLDRWAEVINRHLKPGGAFHIVEFHPVLTTLEPGAGGEPRPFYNYFQQELYFEGNEPSYAGDDPIASPKYEWQHSLGEIVTALADVGLRIDFLHEFPYCAYQALPSMELGEDGWWRFPEKNDSIPQIFSLRAVKSGL
jgi:ubiquinone/menaquinone biosynthesis C-methylase UbiE